MGPFWHFLGPRGILFGFGVRFKDFFGTNLCRQSTLVLEVQPYLFVINSATFWASCSFLGPSGLFFGPFAISMKTKLSAFDFEFTNDFGFVNLEKNLKIVNIGNFEENLEIGKKLEIWGMLEIKKKYLEKIGKLENNLNFGKKTL